MKRFLTMLILGTLMVQSWTVRADEGMWLPLLIKRLNHVDMQAQGLQLTAEEIYSVNNSSLKDAIVRLGQGFCTAEIISKDGLVLTNHHCAYDLIQNHSSVENDYLKDGFWAMSNKEELPNEGITASLLVRMEDVTGKVLSGVTDETSPSERAKIVGENMGKLQEEAEKENADYEVSIREFFQGNEYYMFIYNTYKDVRLVGAPPSSIGKYGGDTDNWMWPRHTGDFSLLRIYTGPDGKPAEYSENNIPLKPKHHLPVSTAGVKKDDFAMVMGYPGSTDRYLTSEGVVLEMEQVNKTRIKVRDRKLAILKEAMDKSDETRIKYASKYSQSSNYYKYSIGQNKGFTRMRTVENKRAQEEAFDKWASADLERQKKYGKVTSELANLYKQKSKYNPSRQYLIESVFQGAEIHIMAFQMMSLYRALSAEEQDKDAIEKMKEDVREAAKAHFKDYDADIDKQLFGDLLALYYKGTDKSQHAEIFKLVETKYKGNFQLFADAVFKTSNLTSLEKVNAFLEKPSAKKLNKDLGFKTVNSIYGDYLKNIRPELARIDQEIDENNRLYIEGLRKMNPDKKYYPDANSTMRVTFGKVSDYVPMDAVFYKHYTTLDGVMEKMDNTNDEFVVPKKLEKLYKSGDFGPYGEDGKLNVNFITTNDITGGNSGSPVINGKGQLIGLAFDGNWEAMSGDIAYDKVYKRCINVDIRYVLFVIDKYAGAGHLVKEMTLVNN
ncbi:MAG: S46 family peptidase [Bacteroidia bacterium]|nr:S46 family peptidase [Bacteroidia bacterium]